ncbi:hypothetical protein [Paracoccus pacificus]|uniref:DNA pilot protein n=1 Tax=Paracoccus pacificus TaxID=1463598 RepID=A0ABW4R448_9RHOB
MALGLGSILGIAKAGVDILGGLFGLKKANEKQPGPRENLLAQAQGAREAAAKYGFNPLTMLQYGQTGPGLSGGAPPLASIDLLSGGLAGLDDVISGDAARRRQADQLELDLAKIRLDQARSGVYQIEPQAVHSIGVGPSPLGRRSGQVVQRNVQVVTPRMAARSARNPGYSGPTGKFSAGESRVTPGRPVKVDEVSNTGGVIEVENAFTGGPVIIPGDGGEPWGWDEMATALMWGAPQVVYNKLSSAAKAGAVRLPRDGFAEPGLVIDMDAGRVYQRGKKEEKSKRDQYDLRGWPFNGLNPTSDAYRRK